MKKLLLLTKTLLAAALLCVGQNAWGEGWSLNFESLGNSFNQDKGEVQLSAAVESIAGTNMSTITYGSSEPYTKFNDNFVVQTGTSWLLRNNNRGLYMQVNGTRSFGCLGCTEGQTITIVTDGKTVAAVTNVTLKSNESNTYVFTVAADGNVKFTLANYGIIKSIAVEDPSATAKNYTVKYVDSEGNEIKSQTVYSGEAGEDAVIYSTDKEKITYNDVNYCYTSDDSEGKTIAADESTVVTVTFHEAATYNYTINAKYGDVVLKTTAGSSEEEDAVTYCYNKYYNYNGTLVQKLASSNSYWVSFTPDADNYAKNDSYSLSDISNVIFFSEAEDIATLTARTSQYLSDRFSGGKGAFAETSDKVVATLPAGTYKLTAKIMGTYNQPSTFTFKAGENTIWESATSASTFYANGEITGDEFTLDAETDIVLVSNTNNGGGNSSKVMNLVDYFYIQKISTTNEVVGTLDYTTTFNGQNKAMTINKGQTINVSFKNNGGSVQWLNWIVRFYTTGLDNTLRADNYVLGDESATKGTRSVKLNDTDVSDWATFTTDMEDATVDMTIAYTAAGMFSIEATAVGGGNTYVHNYSYNTALSDAINLQLGVDHSWLEVTSYEVVNPTSVSVEVSAAGMATYVPAYNLDFTDTNIAAYTAEVTAKGVCTLTEIKKVPAGTPVLLIGTTDDIPVAASTDAVGTNNLVAGTGATVATNQTIDEVEYTNMILNNVGGNVGFYFANGQTVAANRAYLHIAKDMAPDAVGGARMAMLFAGDNITSVANVEAAAEAKAKESKFIENGKLVIVKNGVKYNAAGAQVK